MSVREKVTELFRSGRVICINDDNIRRVTVETVTKFVETELAGMREAGATLVANLREVKNNKREESCVLRYEVIDKLRQLSDESADAGVRAIEKRASREWETKYAELYNESCEDASEIIKLQAELKAIERRVLARFSDLAVELEKHSNDHIHDDNESHVIAASVEGVCADRIKAILVS